jgi:radical SAM protein with 4Fe4S-binding SPASM domain
MDQDVADAKEFFALARRVNSALTTHCQQRVPKDSENVKYLWIYASHRGINHSGDVAVNPRPDLEHWLNVVDEAAGLGVQWLVVTVLDALSSQPDLWTICDWAQQTHGMTVGIHTECAAISAEERDQLRGLDANKTRLFVPRANMEQLSFIEQEDGIRLRSAEPEPGTIGGDCHMPGTMVFVNPDGVLYTCGMVQDNADYRLGNAEDTRFDAVTSKSGNPAKVPSAHIQNEHGCDGCPPLLARHLKDD